MRPVVALAVKDLRLLLRNRGDLFFVLGWPLLLAVFFGVIFSGPSQGRSPLAVAVVDLDGTDGSRDFGERLAEGAGLSVLRTSTREEAATLVRQGKRVAFVVLTPGFGAAAARPFQGPGPKVEIGVDPSRTAESAMLEGLLAQQAAAGLQKVMGDPEASRKIVRDSLNALRLAPPGSASRSDTERFLNELERFLERSPPREGAGPSFQPLTVESKPVAVERRAPRHSFEFTFPQGILWGIMACAANFGIGLVAERAAGTLLRLLAAPLSRRELLLSKALGCFAAILMVEILLLAVGVAFFGVRPVSPGLLALALLSAAAAFVGIMMLLAALGRTEQAASGAGWAALLVMAMLGGGMVPLFVMPPWMLVASNASPAKWAILGFEGALWRGFSPAEMALPCAILWGVGAACFAAGARSFRQRGGSRA
jgi:ABC-2 type transport system permease protein